MLRFFSPANEISFGQLDKSKVVKPRRYKASQIPDQPVEMPCGIDNLQYDVRCNTLFNSVSLFVLSLINR